MALNFANNNSLSAITTLPASISGGAMTLISEQTASGSANLSFTSGIDDTYDSYVFKFINCHPSINDTHFQFNGSTDSGSNYNVTKTTTHFSAVHNEADDASSLGYKTGLDLAQSTSFQTLVEEVGADNDQCLSGYLQLFNPSSTTFVKHFTARCNNYRRSNYSADHYTAGYGNTTSAVDAIKFQMSSGNIDAGQILLFGVN